MPRTPDQALAAALTESSRPSRNWTGLCMMFTRMMYGVSAVGDYDRDGDADAVDGWKSARRKHPTKDPYDIPRGVPVFWSGGRDGYGHAAISVGGGQMWSTDIERDGKVDLAPIADVKRKWGLELLGWTEDINGTTVYEPTKERTTTMTPEEKRVIASLTRIEAVLWAVARALGFGKQLDAALVQAEKNNRDKGVIK
jgi:cell wall-associated NlpC family hydrolase